MRNLSLLILSFLVLNVSAQITITQDDMPSPDSSYFVTNAGLFNDYDFSETGFEYTWDYSDLEPAGQQERNYIEVSEAPFSYQFLFNNPFDQEHLADHAIQTDGFQVGEFSLDDFYEFYQLDEEAYTIVGYGATINSIPIPGVNDPVDNVYEFPLDYADFYESYSEWEVEVPTLGAYKLEQSRDVDVDGWGTLITPYGEFEVIKVRMEIDANDSLYIDFIQQGFTFERNSVEYHWLAKEEGIPVLRVIENLGLVSQILYKDIEEEEEEPDNVDELLLAQMDFYPNPTRGGLYISNLPAGASVTVYSLDGKVLEQGIQFGFVDLSNFANGFYLVEVQTTNAVRRERINLVK
ncbi:T9SS type A sorting domain-containing protein [Sanyastnella coralliicola]|uniref:T9SS type A sorting domain-containing protein n=1 Tax=Sanyastnella coralliicola TaxID=3069118 RepID=UPI0027B9A816|nr:T9SS type A sorting domain-containing protein [Longitalea sp. SCSIO 12813]